MDWTNSSIKFNDEEIRFRLDFEAPKELKEALCEDLVKLYLNLRFEASKFMELEGAR